MRREDVVSADGHVKQNCRKRRILRRFPRIADAAVRVTRADTAWIPGYGWERSTFNTKRSTLNELAVTLLLFQGRICGLLHRAAIFFRRPDYFLNNQLALSPVEVWLHDEADMAPVVFDVFW